MMLASNNYYEKMARDRPHELRSTPQPRRIRHLRGYVYQAKLTILRWLDLKENKVLELERGEDIDLVKLAQPASAEEERRVLEQVKALSRKVSLKSESIIESLANFLEHQRLNPGKNLFFRFTTTATVMGERSKGINLDAPGIVLWERVRTTTITAEKKQEYLMAIRNLLGNAKKPKKIKPKLWEQYTKLVGTESDRVFKEFIGRFEIATQQETLVDLSPRIITALLDKGLATSTSSASPLHDKLVAFMFTKVSSPGRKQLTLEELSVRVVTPLGDEERTLLQGIQEKIATLEHQVSDNTQDIKVLRTDVELLNATLSYSFAEPAKRFPGWRNNIALARFTGRDQERSYLKNLLAGGSQRLIQVCGQSGMGKSTLVTKTLNDLHDDQNYGAFVYVYQNDLRIGGVATVFDRLAETLESDARLHWAQTFKKLGSNIQAQVVELLKVLPQRTVLYIDNFETLLDDENKITEDNIEIAQFIEYVVTQVSSLTIIVTSQKTLTFPPQIQALTSSVTTVYPHPNGLDGLPPANAAELLYALDGYGSAGVRETDQSILEGVILGCEGKPQVLEVLVGTALELGLAFKDVLENKVMVKRILHEPFQVLYDNQASELKYLLNLLAVFGKPVKAETLANVMKRDLFQIKVQLARLLRRFAVQRIQEHELYYLRFADETPILESIGETQLKRHDRKIAGYYKANHVPPDDIKTFSDVESRLDEVFHRTRAEEYDEACDAFTDIDQKFLLPWGLANLMLIYHLGFEGNLKRPGLVGANLKKLAMAYHELGHNREAQTYLQKALAHAESQDKEYRNAGTRENLGTAHGDLANFYLGESDITAFKKHSDLAFEIAKNLFHRYPKSPHLSRYTRNFATQTGNLGMSLLESAENNPGNIRAANEFFQQALELSERVNHTEGMSISTTSAPGSSLRYANNAEASSTLLTLSFLTSVI